MSTGLEYTPGTYAQEAELLALAEVVGSQGGMIMSHMRNEDDDQLLASIDELLRQGLVTMDEDGLIHADADAFVGPADLGQKIHFFSENVGDHISAAVENLLANESRFIERAVFYNRLLPSSVTEIEQMADQLGNMTLNELNRIAHQKQSEDMDDEDANERFRFGIFFYHTTEGYDDDDED